MRNKETMDATDNRGVFNRAYKEYLEHKGKIHCSYCKYHKGENYKGNSYGGYGKVKLPNWKLVSKNPKQWMKKPMKIVEKPTHHPMYNMFYTEIKF